MLSITEGTTMLAKKSMKFDRVTILLIAVSILLTLQIKSCIDPSRVDAKVIEAQVKLKQYETELPEIRKELNIIYDKYDSLLLASVQRYENLEQKKEPLKYVIKQVPIIVDNLDREQLRRAIAEY